MDERQLIEIFKEALQDYYKLKNRIEEHHFKTYKNAQQYYRSDTLFIEVSNGIITTHIKEVNNIITIDDLIDIRKGKLYIKNHSIEFIKDLIKTDV